MIFSYVYNFIDNHYMIQEEVKDKNKVEEEQPLKQDKQGNLLYWMCILSGNLLAINTCIDIFVDDSQIIATFNYIVTVFILVALFINSCQICQNRRQIVKAFLLLDNSFLALIIALVGRNVLFYRLYQDQIGTLEKTILALYSFTMFVYLGNFRLMMINCNWGRWKVICAKVSLILNACVYLIVYVIIKVNQLQEIGRIDSTLAASFKDLIFYYVFGMFTFVYELFNKITQKDGTKQYKYYYSFQKPKEEQSHKNEQQVKKQQNNQTQDKLVKANHLKIN